ncbi:hypothetical protein scyTo_0005878 [Scyliorhinus torazame]|uniref:SEA domain-containing protein n=1 Tax=Scyliorhinus torazame TaxID=75743 RepID=A0A401PDK5_SCYTO|nr:hypothetical protein [Scyliorhinus torazame]
MKNFTDDLDDSSTPGFRNLATSLENALNPIYRQILIWKLTSELALCNDTKTLDIIELNGDITLSNLQPMVLNIDFVIENETFNGNLINSTSSEFMSLKTILDWLKGVLKTGFDPNVLPNSVVTFSNESMKVRVNAHIQINTTRVENRPLLLDLIINNVNTSGFDIIKSSIRVNGAGVAVDSIQVSIRFEGETFVPDLSNRSSSQFKQLSNRVTEAMNVIFANNSNFTEVIINGFRAGSVIAEVTTIFKEGTTIKANVVDTLTNSVATFGNRDLTLDTNFLNGITTTAAVNVTQATTVATIPTTRAVPPLDVRRTPLRFSLNQTFVPALNEPSSAEFQSLKLRIVNQLQGAFSRRAPAGFQNLEVNNFREGSVIASCSVNYNLDAVPLSPSEAVKILDSELQNSTNLGNLRIIRDSIQSGDITLNNLQPIDLKISFLIENEMFTASLTNNASSEFMQLRNAVVTWLETLLKSRFDPNVLPNSRVNFSDKAAKVLVNARVRINTTRLEDRPMLRNLIANNVSTSNFDIIKSSIEVNGDRFTVDNFQLPFRFPDLTFTSSLTNRSSPRFRGLNANITNVVNGIFANDRDFIELFINEFRSGSVISQAVGVFNSGTTERSSVITTLARNEAAFSRANLALDTNFLTGTPPSTPAGPSRPTPPKPFPGFAIAIIVLGILAIIAIPFLVVLFVKTGYCSKVANAFKLETPDDVDMKRPMFGGKSYNFQ